MSKLLCFLAVPLLLAVRCAASQAVPTALPSQTAVSSVSAWPTGNLLKHNDKAEVTTFDMPGVPFPCRVQSVTADQLICGKTHERQMIAFDRKTVQSIAVVGHARKKASVIFYASAAGLLVGGLACAGAGGSVVCASLLTASIAAFVGGQVAQHTEQRLGPTDARTVYIAPVNAPSAPSTIQQLPASGNNGPMETQDAEFASWIQ